MYWQLISDYYELCKPKVVIMMLITAWIGMQLATDSPLPLSLWVATSLGIGFASASAAVINHLIDRRIDALMARTLARPIASGRIEPLAAICFSAILATIGGIILWVCVNPITFYLTFLTLLGYAFFYTIYLKRATPQNIVIGGAAGAMPPLLGWVAVTNNISPFAWLLVLIIYTWTPPHFWALAIYRFEDYKKADIPMLPVTHGIAFTKLSILLYTILLLIVSLLPFITQMSGLLYCLLASILGLIFLYYVAKLVFTNNDRKNSLNVFSFSIVYLLALFTALLIDHYFQIYSIQYR